MIRQDRLSGFLNRPSVALRAVLGVLAAFMLSPSVAVAQNAGGGDHGPMIFDVRRSLPLEPDEPVFHDFYINAGPEAGFKKGQYITAVRPLPIQDPVLNKQQAMLDVTVGYLQVIQVQRGITVARLFGELTDEERPALEYESVMIGDRIDMSSLTTKAPKVKEKKKAKAVVAVQSESKSTSVVALVAPPNDKVAAPAANAVAPIPSAPSPSVAGASLSPAAAGAPAPGNGSANSASSPASSPAESVPSTSSSVPSITPWKSASNLAPNASQTTSAQAPSGEIATSSNPAEKTSPSASSPDMVRIPVPAGGDIAQKDAKKDAPKEL